MAYVRREQNMMELAYPLKKVWAAIPKALARLGWNMVLIDDIAHQIKTKTQSSIMAWGSVILIHVELVDKDTTRVSVAAETAVTAVTGLLDFGRTRQRIESFFQELQRQLS